MVINPFITFQSRLQQQQKRYRVAGQRRGNLTNTTATNNNHLGKILSMTLLFTSTLGGIVMVFNLLFSRQSGGTALSSSSSTSSRGVIAMSSSSSPSSIVVSPSEIENRLKGALFAYVTFFCHVLDMKIFDFCKKLIELKSLREGREAPCAFRMFVFVVQYNDGRDKKLFSNLFQKSLALFVANSKPTSNTPFNGFLSLFCFH